MHISICHESGFVIDDIPLFFCSLNIHFKSIALWSSDKSVMAHVLFFLNNFKLFFHGFLPCRLSCSLMVSCWLLDSKQY